MRKHPTKNNHAETPNKKHPTKNTHADPHVVHSWKNEPHEKCRAHT